ncbi:hypothetical protein BKA70DRAFT_592890 [Coprinopsis sp. MPI-PUGE-AT-0042]|nr:hypothetical protein BKA70DRAFT_592890 [Coprinopsis sp. MPI-PUGE-AT-0042]
MAGDKAQPREQPTRVGYRHMLPNNAASLASSSGPPSPVRPFNAYTNGVETASAETSEWQTSKNRRRVRWVERVDVRVFHRFDEELDFDGSQSPAPLDPVHLPEASFRNGTFSWVCKVGRPYSKASYSTMEFLPSAFSTNEIHQTDAVLVFSPNQGWHHLNPHLTYPKPCIRLPHPSSPRLRALEIEEDTAEIHPQSPNTSPTLPGRSLSPLPSDVYNEFLELGAHAPTRNSHPNSPPMSTSLSIHSSPKPWTPTRNSRGSVKAPTPVVRAPPVTGHEANSSSSQVSSSLDDESTRAVKSPYFPALPPLSPSKSRLFSLSPLPRSPLFSFSITPVPSSHSRARLPLNTISGGESPPEIVMGPSPPALSPAWVSSTATTPTMGPLGPSPSAMYLSPPMMVSPPMFRYGMEYRGMQEQLVG